MIISPFTKPHAERDDSHDLLTLNLAELFEQFPIRLRDEPADTTSMVAAMTAVDKSKSKRVQNWGDNSNIIGRIGNVYTALSTEAAEIVDAMSVGSLDELGLETRFNPYRNDEYLTKITEQDAAPLESVETTSETNIQAEMAKEARMIIENSFKATESNFSLRA